MKIGIFHGARVMLLCLALGACADRPGQDILNPVAVENTDRLAAITVATTRARSTEDPDRFTAMRAEALNFQRYDISIPPDHKRGAIEFPKAGAADPKTAFVVARADASDFGALKSGLSVKANPSGEVAVFIHGYNTTYTEALFRAAQLKSDMEFPGATVAFIWPSRGAVGDYLTDRDSATYSRDYLQHFLDEVAATPDVRKIHLIAHSMGNWLTVETLRQAKLGGHSKFLAKLDRVLLMSPDIDVDVFRTQMEAIGRLNPPITVLTSEDDKALGVSTKLSGDVPRLGDLPRADPRVAQLVQKYGLLIIDLTQFKGLDGTNHSKFANALPLMREMRDANPNPNKQAADIITQPGNFVIDAAGRALMAPLRAVTGEGAKP